MELVVIPREEYEEFLQWQKAIRPPRILKTFKPTPTQLRDMKRGREDYKKGKYITAEDIVLNFLR